MTWGRKNSRRRSPINNDLRFRRGLHGARGQSLSLIRMLHDAVIAPCRSQQLGQGNPFASAIIVRLLIGACGTQSGGSLPGDIQMLHNGGMQTKYTWRSSGYVQEIPISAG